MDKQQSGNIITRNWRRFKVWYKGLYRGRPWWVKTLAALGTFLVLFLLYLVAVDINLLWLFGKSPSTYSIMHPRNPEASYLYSADGKTIGKYYDENRTPVTYDSINPQFFQVLIDTEDERFYKHHGIDFGGLGAALKDMVLHGRPRGASTITQQLVKNMFRTRSDYSTGLLGYIPGVKMLIMKSKEWIIATKLEIFYSKKEILEMYANTVDFGSNAYGIKTAANTYFKTTPRNLKLEESAVLVGLLKATSTYNPRINPKNSLRRRNQVLKNMVSRGDLTEAQYDSVSSLPIDLKYTLEANYDGVAPYFREAVAREIEGIAEAQGLKLDLERDGLKIYTTLDSKMQEYAEQAVSEKMKVVQQNFKSHWGDNDCWLDENNQPIANFVEDKARNTPIYHELLARYPNDLDSVNYYMNQPHMVHLFDYENDSLYMEMSSMDSVRYMLHFMHCGFIAIEPDTREVKAWIGNIDYDTWNFDNITAKHQPGSTFKLFVYTEAMNQGMTPCTRKLDSWASYKEPGDDKSWTPHNANGTFSDTEMTLKRAFASSINSVAVKGGLEVGVKNIINTAHEMGIQTPLKEAKSICLGSSVVDLLELTNSYCTIANDGKYNMPIMITSIEDRDGNIIYKSKKNEKQAVPYKSAYLMQILLRGGLHGTSAAMWEYIGGLTQTTDFGGKTGTSNNHADAWYIGVTPKLVGGVWVGGEFPSIHFRTGALGQGGRAALPIFGDFIKNVLRDERFSKYKAKFPEPKGLDPNLWQCSDYVEEPDSTLSDENESSDYSDGEITSNNSTIEPQNEFPTSEE